MTTLTEGQKRVGINFNPSGNALVDAVKTAAASMIDMALAIVAEPTASPRERRAAAEAATHYENAAMWHVKALTMPKEPATEEDKASG